MANATPEDARKNQAVAHKLVDDEPATVAAQIGLHALAKLADMMPHEEFLNFINESLQQVSGAANTEQ